MLSAILFCAALSAVIFKTEEECIDSGFIVGRKLISNLSYADDIALTNSSIGNLQSFLNRLCINAKEIGLRINLAKTVVMTTDINQLNIDIRLNNKKIDQVHEFVYLGHKLSCRSDQEVSVKHRIGLGWAAFGKHQSLIKSTRVPIHTKVKIYNTYILPVVLYINK